MTFPQIVGALIAAGFESYEIDFRRATATYYLPDGDSVQLVTHNIDTLVAPDFDPTRIGAAITEAQQLVPGYTYKGFCKKGCCRRVCGLHRFVLGPKGPLHRPHRRNPRRTFSELTGDFPRHRQRPVCRRLCGRSSPSGTTTQSANANIFTTNAKTAPLSGVLSLRNFYRDFLPARYRQNTVPVSERHILIS